jgi:hypothetical protein
MTSSRCAIGAAALSGALVMLSACDSPTQPIVDFGQGVTLYPDSLYRGDDVTLGGDVSDLSEVEGPCGGDENTSSNYDDCVSSIRIPEGWAATVYRDRNFRGASATYSADVPDLDVVVGPCDPGFNDCVSSIKVFRR